jgi:hypothetical protein
MNVLGYYPALSSAGFIKDPVEIATALFTVPFVSNQSQSTLYRDIVSSIGYIYQQSGGYTDSFPGKIEDMYTNLFSRYFSSVSVTVEELSTDEPEDYVIVIVYGDGSEERNLSDTIFEENGIIYASNYGGTP